MNVQTLRFFRDNPEAMRALDDVAARRGQSIEVTVVPDPDDDDGPEVAVVRYSASREPIGLIHADGGLEEA